jgi:hypothetical protein
MNPDELVWIEPLFEPRQRLAQHMGLAAGVEHDVVVGGLDPAGDFGTLLTARQLFPERGQDLFGDYLERALEGGLPSGLKKYVEQLYWVVDE